VPLSARLRVLFGGFNNQFGWIFFGFGLIFVWAFALQADVASPFLFRFQTKSTQGIVERVQESSASENETAIFEVSYTYFDNLGRQQSGTSYSTGAPGVGARVTVEYLTGFPSISRVEGMRRKPFGPFALISILFPLIGLGFLYAGIKYGLKANRLLKQGRIAFGKLISSEATGASINDQPVIKLTFSFTANDGEEYEAIAKTHEPEDLRDEEEEPLLYDEKDPSYAVLLDDLPGSTAFDPSGKLNPASAWETVKVLFFPSLTVIGHGIYILFSIFR
jgi:hypothetical protein